MMELADYRAQYRKGFPLTSTIHLNQIKKKITALFDGKIDLSDVNQASPHNNLLPHDTD